ncbi:hypothetical protein Z951_46445 [Streptomyces sp. PRh5]|uniref:hypothetical protein n=1 Tax=Streptomyces sp. PRh5 TaxID=1158056 RepID=UPI0004510AB0|nr:hypothetical protein [Streptomyces sp. PRh5]EXU61585.1 hypothetical protein Z951_46445 [Streptomyces sp. PRh5]
MGPARIVGAAVIDGSGRDPGKLDVTIENGRITRLGASSAHGERLDAEGLTMTPGLIDSFGGTATRSKTRNCSPTPPTPSS